MTLSEERREFEEQKRLFDMEKREFFRKVEFENRRMEQEKSLFDMKLKVLEQELKKLAIEKEEIAKKKAFYEMVDEFQARNRGYIADEQIVSGEMFFRGVCTKESLKKRYKDLIKIYHPDNADGDGNTVMEINKEYDYLCQILI